MLRYTGHPLVDVGVATIGAFARKPDITTITERDLDHVAEFISREYVRDPLKSFLNVAFPNSGYTQPAYEKAPEKRAAYAERVTRAYAADLPTLDQKCPFTGEAAVAVSLSVSGSLPHGQAFRQHVPLLTREGVINFHPLGVAGLPVSGKALLCVQALPMGCAKCGGRLLAVHSDSPELMYEFALEFLTSNRAALALAHQSQSRKMREAPASAKTLLVQTLLEIEQRRLDEARERRPSSVTAYHLTNSGQSSPLDPRNPPLSIYHLPIELTGFLAQVLSAEYRTQWQAIVQRAWQLARGSGKKKTVVDNSQQDDEKPRRNLLYEDLFLLPTNAGSFIRRYFLRVPVRTRFEDDPRRTYSLRDEASLLSWTLVDLFLRRVLGVEKDRVEQIRSLGDRLGAYIASQDDKRFFTAFFEHRYDYFRTALIRANLNSVRAGNEPLIGLDPYMEIFEEGAEMPGSSWRLARDLVLIRMVEQLYHLGWLGSNPEAIPDMNGESEPQSTAD